LDAEVVRLKEQVSRLRRDVLRLQFEAYVQNETNLLSQPTSINPDCEFAVAQWGETQKSLKGFLDDSVRTQTEPDAYILAGIKRHLYILNKTCKSNLVWNPQ
jgi:hypothetical protein